MRMRLIVGACVACLIVGFSLSGPVWAADTYPSRPIDLLVSAPPGGGHDIAARLISAYYSKAYKVQMNVINKGGGSGIPAIREMMAARPDGYLMYCEVHGAPLTAAFLPGQLPFDWRKRTWIARMTTDPLAYQVRMDAPWKTLKEVAEFIKNNPKKLNYGSSGVNGVGLSGGVQFLLANKLSFSMANHVSFPGEAQVLTALAAGNLDFASQNFGPSWGLIEGKKSRPIAVVSKKRLALIPDVPTVAEAGYPMLDVNGWHGISGPPGLPKEIVDYWVTSLEKASKDPVFHEMAANAKKEVAYLGPKDFVDFVEKEYQKFLLLATESGYK